MPYKTVDASRRHGRAYYQINCEVIKDKRREYYRLHRDKIKQYNAAYRAKRRVELNLTERKRYYTKKDSILFHKYGIREKDVAILLASQDGGCAICKSAKLLGVDHAHDTGKVRGILCRKCNSGIGQLGDDAGRVQRAADYLKGYINDPLLSLL